jgi:hypothetical protein
MKVLILSDDLLSPGQYLSMPQIRGKASKKVMEAGQGYGKGWMFFWYSSVRWTKLQFKGERN